MIILTPVINDARNNDQAKSEGIKPDRRIQHGHSFNHWGMTHRQGIMSLAITLSSIARRPTTDQHIREVLRSSVCSLFNQSRRVEDSGFWYLVRG